MKPSRQPRNLWQTPGPRRKARPCCFTLIELIVVIVIMGIVAAVGIGMFGGSIANQRIDASLRRIQADMALARQSAAAKSATQSVLFIPGSGKYTLGGMPDPDRPGTDYTVDLSLSPYEAEIVSADFDGDAELIFNAYGQPDSAGTLVVDVGGIQVTLTFSAETGQISGP